jgi:maleylacetate reductase
VSVDASASHRFTLDLRTLRVVFGAGSLSHLPDELARLGFTKPFVITTPGRTEDLSRVQLVLGSRIAGVFRDAREHVPRRIVAASLGDIRRAEPDSVVTIGGGSAIGLGKIVARETHLPVVSIPTTYAGSEMTDTWGETNGVTKRTGRDKRVAPVLVIYDPELTLTLPPEVSAASGMNGIAHAVEALYAPDATPLSTLAAGHALRQFGRHLPIVVRSPSDLPARAGALEAAHFAGMALGMTTMGLHHKLCHVLGGALDLPHALTHAVILPHVARYNAPAAPEAMNVVAAALDGADGPSALTAFEAAIGLRVTLGDLGVRDEDLDRVSDLTVAASPVNPSPVTRDAVRGILAAAMA